MGNLVSSPALRCPVCHDGLARGAAPLLACSGCLTVAHAECVTGPCPTLGCRGTPARPPCRSWPWVARLGLAAIGPAIVLAAWILQDAPRQWFLSELRSYRSVALDLSVTRAVVQPNGRLLVEGGGEASDTVSTVCVNETPATVHNRELHDEFWWSVELPLESADLQQGEWVTLRLSAWAGDVKWSSLQTVPVVDARAFDPDRTDGALVDVAVVASTSWPSVPLRGRITGCTPAATLEVRGPGVDVRLPARAGPFEVTVALPGPGQHELSVSLREPTGHVATVTRRVTRVGP